MGRAANTTSAVTPGAFDSVVGARRGQRSELQSVPPTSTGRAQAQALIAACERGDSSWAVETLAAAGASAKHAPLLVEVAEAVGAHALARIEFSAKDNEYREAVGLPAGETVLDGRASEAVLDLAASGGLSEDTLGDAVSARVNDWLLDEVAADAAGAGLSSVRAVLGQTGVARRAGTDLTVSAGEWRALLADYRETRRVQGELPPSAAGTEAWQKTQARGRLSRFLGDLFDGRP